MVTLTSRHPLYIRCAGLLTDLLAKREHADLDLDTYTNDMFRTEHPNAPFSDPPIINYLGHLAS